VRLSEIEKDLEAVNNTRDGLLAEQAEALGRKYVTCTTNLAYKGDGCGKRTQIRNLVYIQTHFYVSPWGCTGGDFWKEGEGAFNCPKCDYRNRLYDRPDIMDLKPYFESVEDEHEH
jgi:hypothetical protein